MDHSGLALSLATTIATILLLNGLKLDTKGYITTFIKIGLASGVMCLGGVSQDEVV